MTTKVRNYGARRATLGRIIWLAAVVMIFAADLFAQYDYQMTMRLRRMGNQLGVEIWVK